MGINAFPGSRHQSAGRLGSTDIGLISERRHQPEYLAAMLHTLAGREDIGIAAARVALDFDAAIDLEAGRRGAAAPSYRSMKTCPSGLLRPRPCLPSQPSRRGVSATDLSPQQGRRLA